MQGEGHRKCDRRFEDQSCEDKTQSVEQRVDEVRVGRYANVVLQADESRHSGERKILAVQADPERPGDRIEDRRGEGCERRECQQRAAQSSAPIEAPREERGPVEIGPAARGSHEAELSRS